MRRPLLALLTVLALHEAAPAQTRRAAPPPPPPREQPAPEPPPAAYEPELLRLAEVLGALSYMTGLCGEAAGGWHERMLQLIEAEGITPQRRDRLAGAFNRGYLGHQPMHRRCTDRAREAISRLTDQGQRLAREIAGRYTG